MIHFFEYLRIRSEINRHLISWADSGLFELAAKEVLCLTPNLLWAQMHVDDILRDAANNSGKKYRYIIFANNVDGNAGDAIHNAELIIGEARKNSKIQSNDALSILFLTQQRTKSSPYFWSASNSSSRSPAQGELAFLPIPTDIVIYKQTTTDLKGDVSNRRTFAVMSVTPFDKQVETMAARLLVNRGRSEFGLHQVIRDARFAYDMQLCDRTHYEPLEKWFNWEWEYRTGAE